MSNQPFHPSPTTRARTGWRALALLAVGVLALGGQPPPGDAAVRTQGLNQVGLVVHFGDGSSITRCVTFSEPQISGLEVLERSDLDVVTHQSVVCAIEGTGCPAGDCWCQCQGGGSCTYWSYWHWVDGAWQFAQTGAGLYQVTGGDIEGWHWGASTTPSSTPSFEAICSLSAVYLPIVLRL
jgi:hypothetical protein